MEENKDQKQTIFFSPWAVLGALGAALGRAKARWCTCGCAMRRVGMRVEARCGVEAGAPWTPPLCTNGTLTLLSGHGSAAALLNGRRCAMGFREGAI